MPGIIDARLAELKVTLPEASRPVANFLPCVLSGRTLYVSGQIPMLNRASDLLVEVFGQAVGGHARFAVGAGSLPYNVAVEVAVVLEVLP